MSEQQQETWAIVELFGHQRIAGKISEHNLGGTFVRVDVPPCDGRPGFTKLYGQNAIYGITFVDRDIALAAAERMAVKPVTAYDLGAVTADAVRGRLEYAGYREPDDGF